MRTHLGRVLAGLLTVALSLTAVTAPAPASASVEDRKPTHLTLPAAVELPSAAHGKRALRLLGDDLDRAAGLNNMTGEHLRALLLEDPSVWLDTRGRVFYMDAAPPAPAVRTPVPAAPFPLAETFALQSKPGSDHTIYLDFNGATVAGTYWNSQKGVSSAPGAHPAWDLSGNGPAFSDTELEAVQFIWQQVAEDYAPFDVNVTTQDLGLAAISRSSQADLTYGSHALITDSTDALDAICQGGCGGVAYLDVFSHYPGKQYQGATDNSLHSQYQPAWVFPQALGDDPKVIAEAASHEVGHNLALEHDGLSGGEDYYDGHGAWAPVMGGAYERPISQFSNGSYSGANNGQDDLAIVGAELGLRPDEAGDGVPQATALVDDTAYITTRSDRDTYALGVCSGPLTVAAAVAPTAPNLDLELTLLDEAGGVVETVNPLSVMVSSTVASGMGATLTRDVALGPYFIRVDGVGKGSPTSGYDDYGSIGAYTLAASGCDATQPGAPSLPQNLSVVAHPTAPSITVTWTAPIDSGDSDITGYVVALGGATPVELGHTTFSHTFTGLAAGTTYPVTVRARNATGSSEPAAGSATTAPDPITTPSAPTIGDATSGRRGGKATATVRWSPPQQTGGAPVTGYQLLAHRLDKRGKVVKTLRSGLLGAGVRSVVAELPKGRYKFSVRARNGEGFGPLSGRSNTVRAR